MIKLLRTLLTRKKDNATAYPFKTQGCVHIVERNGGRIVVHPSVLLNSLQEGYHVGMPFETTLVADNAHALIQIGAKCRIHGAYIHAWDKITVGQGVLIGAGTNIIDSHGHSGNIRYARFRRHFRDTPQAITIKDFVWVGMNCIILKGVEIGECAIVSAGSVVKDSVPAFSIVEGNPARVRHIYDSQDALEESYPLHELAKEEGFFNY